MLSNVKFLSCNQRYSYLFLLNSPFLSHASSLPKHHITKIIISNFQFKESFICNPTGMSLSPSIFKSLSFIWFNIEINKLGAYLEINIDSIVCSFHELMCNLIANTTILHETECSKWAKLLIRLLTNQAIFSSIIWL